MRRARYNVQWVCIAIIRNRFRRLVMVVFKDSEYITNSPLLRHEELHFAGGFVSIDELSVMLLHF